MAYHKCASIYGTNNSAASVQTASGAIANFNTKLAMPIKSLEVDVNATQDLHGQSAPYPAGGSAQRWDEQWESGAFDITTGANITANDQIRAKNKIPVTPGETYFINAYPALWIIFYDKDENVITSGLPEGNQSASNCRSFGYTTISHLGVPLLPVPVNCYFIRFYCQKAYGTTYNNDISINYPATDTEYHPYSNICPIGGWDSVKLYKRGKNLVEMLVDGLVPSITSGALVSATGARSNFVFVKPNTTYTFSCYFGQTIYAFFYESNDTDTFISYSGVSATKNTFTTPANCNYIMMRLSTNDFSASQLEVGNSATTYEPYNGNVVTIALGGTYYGGQVEIDKNGRRRFKVTHAQFVIDSNTPNKYWGEAYYQLGFSNVLAGNLAKYNASIATYKSDKLLAVATNDRAQHIGNFIILIGSGSGVAVSIPDCTTQAQAETFLQNNNIQFVYELATPYYIDLIDGTPIKTLPGVNNIYADTGDTEVAYKKLA